MRHFPTLPTILLFLLLSGCGSVSSSVDGRGITGKSFFYSTLISNGHKATLNVDGRQLQITGTQVCWDKGSVALPEKWNQLSVVDSLGTIEITVDGSKLAALEPND